MQTTNGVRVRKWILALVGVVLASGLLGMVPWPTTHYGQRMRGEARWDARPFPNYRLTVEITRMQRVCVQELDVRNDKAQVINDTCDISWLSSMTVNRLFEMSAWMERAPDCYPSSRNCPCQRVRLGHIIYDPQLGYPREIVWQREIQANVDHIDFWQQLWEDRSLPQCNASVFPIRMAVLSLVPIQ